MSYRIDEIEAVEVGDTKQTKLYDTPVDLQLVNFKVIKNWITKTMGNMIPDDDIIVDYIEELLVQGDAGSPNIKEIETQLNSFLGPGESRKFCKQLWKLLVSAQEDKDGIPKQLIDQEKERLEKERKEQAKQEHGDSVKRKGFSDKNNQRKYQSQGYKRPHANNNQDNITQIPSDRGREENNTHTTNPPHKIRGKYNASNNRRGEERNRDTRGDGRYRDSRGDSRGEYERHRDRSPRRTGNR